MALRFFLRALVIAVLTVVTGCTLLIIPKPRKGQGEDFVYLHIHDSGATNSTSKPAVVVPKTTSPSPAPLYPNDIQCHNLITPTFSDPPILSVLTTDQRKNVELVENTMVDYALALRSYISGIRDTSNQFFSEYNQACKTVSPPMMQ